MGYVGTPDRLCRPGWHRDRSDCGLAGIDPSSAGTPAAAAALIATMLHGLGISLMSTLLGVLLNVWLSEPETAGSG